MSDLPIIQKTYDLVKWFESGYPRFEDLQDRIFCLNQDIQDLRIYKIELNKNSRLKPTLAFRQGIYSLDKSGFTGCDSKSNWMLVELKKKIMFNR